MKIKTQCVSRGPLRIGGDEDLLLIAGPCVIENEALLRRIAEKLVKDTEDLPFQLVFKASFDKANRSSPGSFRGPGTEKGLELLARLKEEFSLPVLSDVHTVEEAHLAQEVLDIIQIPAFLCRQNDLLREAAAGGKIVNIKKGQFLSPHEVPNRIKAAQGPGGVTRAVVTERGTFFGYNNLVNDFKALVQIRQKGIPLIFDATHSVQLPGQKGTASGGERDFAPPLARAACATGIDGLFFEVHPDPDNALCDGPNCLHLETFRELLVQLAEIDALIR